MLNPFARDREGNTPLHYVAQFDLVEVARWLIENGSRIGVCNHNKETPLDIATQKRRMNMVRYLQKEYTRNY